MSDHGDNAPLIPPNVRKGVKAAQDIDHPAPIRDQSRAVPDDPHPDVCRTRPADADPTRFSNGSWDRERGLGAAGGFPRDDLPLRPRRGERRSCHAPEN